MSFVAAGSDYVIDISLQRATTPKNAQNLSIVADLSPRILRLRQPPSWNNGSNRFIWGNWLRQLKGADLRPRWTPRYLFFSLRMRFMRQICLKKKKFAGHKRLARLIINCSNWQQSRWRVWMKIDSLGVAALSLFWAMSIMWPLTFDLPIQNMVLLNIFGEFEVSIWPSVVDLGVWTWRTDRVSERHTYTWMMDGRTDRQQR